MEVDVISVVVTIEKVSVTVNVVPGTVTNVCSSETPVETGITVAPLTAPDVERVVEVQLLVEVDCDDVDEPLAASTLTEPESADVLWDLVVEPGDVWDAGADVVLDDEELVGELLEELLEEPLDEVEELLDELLEELEELDVLLEELVDKLLELLELLLDDVLEGVEELLELLGVVVVEATSSGASVVGG